MIRAYTAIRVAATLTVAVMLLVKIAVTKKDTSIQAIPRARPHGRRGAKSPYLDKIMERSI